MKKRIPKWKYKENDSHRQRKSDKLTPEQRERLGINDLNRGKPYREYLKIEQERK